MAASAVFFYGTPSAHSTAWPQGPARANCHPFRLSHSSESGIGKSCDPGHYQNPVDSNHVGKARFIFELKVSEYKKRPHYAISRRESGWEVSLQRNRKRFYKTFWDLEFGGETECLKAAQAWRNAVIQDNPPPSRRDRATKLTKANKTGIAGVTCWIGDDGTPVLWRAKTHVGDKILQKTFSIARWGAEARDLAILEREKQLREFAGRAHVHPEEPSIREAAPVGRTSESTRRNRKALQHGMVRQSNKSGSPGVVRRKGWKAHPGYWCAQICSNGQWSSKCFSILIHGDDQAKNLAIEERRRQVASASVDCSGSCGQKATFGRRDGDHGLQEGAQER